MKVRSAPCFTCRATEALAAARRHAISVNILPRAMSVDTLSSPAALQHRRAAGPQAPASGGDDPYAGAPFQQPLRSRHTSGYTVFAYLPLRCAVPRALCARGLEMLGTERGMVVIGGGEGGGNNSH